MIILRQKEYSGFHTQIPDNIGTIDNLITENGKKIISKNDRSRVYGNMLDTWMDNRKKKSTVRTLKTIKKKKHNVDIDLLSPKFGFGKKVLKFEGCLKDTKGGRGGYIGGAGKNWKDVYKGYLQHNDVIKKEFPRYINQMSNKEVKDLIREQAKKELKTKIGVGLGSAAIIGGLTAGGIALHRHLKKKKSEKGEEKDNNKKGKKK